MFIDLSDLQARHDFAESQARARAVIDGAADSGPALLRFLGQYVSWNGHFGSGVATLAGAIARARRLFVEPDEPVHACADRSVHVASYFFDAARDEFDDGATPHRDTHRTLAQATLKGVIAAYDLQAQANGLLEEPAWLAELNEQVHRGYGLGGDGGRLDLFAAMGFHLGSEVLADQEFSVLDGALRRRHPALVQRLLEHRVALAGQEHPAYYWIGIHSGHGGGVEADHFAWAVTGVEEAARCTRPAERPACRRAVLDGFDAFVRCHQRFFTNAG